MINMNNKEKQMLAKRIIEVKKKLEEAKGFYQEMDTLTEQFIKLDLKMMQVEDGPILALKDNFLDKDGSPKNTVFRPAAVKRFEIDIL